MTLRPSFSHIASVPEPRVFLPLTGAFKLSNRVRRPLIEAIRSNAKTMVEPTPTATTAYISCEADANVDLVLCRPSLRSCPLPGRRIHS